MFKNNTPYQYGFGAFCMGAQSSMEQPLTKDMVELLWQQYTSLINFRNANLLVNEVCHYNKTCRELQQQTWLMKIWRDNLEEAVIDCPMTENVLNESPFDFCIPALPIEMLPLKGFLSYLLSAYVFSDFQEDFTQENPTWTTRIYGEEDMVRDMTNVEHIYIPELAELFALYTQHCLSEQKVALEKVTLPTEELRAEHLQSLYFHERNLWADVKPSLPLYISESFAASIIQHVEDYLTYLLNTIRQNPKYADFEKEKTTRNRAKNMPTDKQVFTKEGMHYKAKIKDIFQHAKSDYEIGGLLYKFQHEYKWITRTLPRNSYYRYIQNLIGSERAIDASNANKGYC